MHSITESIQDAIIMIDPKELISFWNPSAQRIFGYTSKEALGQNLHQLLAPQRYLKTYNTAFVKFQQTGQGKAINKTLELEGCKKNGKEIFIELSLSAVRFEGKWHAVGIVRDISERKKTQEMMIQSEKMLSVGGLAAGMAHEINNPLAGMIQSANVMINRLTNIEMPANQRIAKEVGINLKSMKTYIEKRGVLPMIKAITESGLRVAEIVNNMLSYARKSDSSLSSHAPADLLDKIIELAATDYDLKKKYDFKIIGIIKKYEDDLPIVLCEGIKIQQVLLNILRNGAQAMHERMRKNKGYKPQFILRLARETKTNMLRIEIEDNGPGMDEATRKRIFEPFFTTKPTGSGSGLGLSVSYFIITQNHGGSMDVISEPDKGATFIIRLPLEGRKNKNPPR